MARRKKRVDPQQAALEALVADVRDPGAAGRGLPGAEAADGGAGAAGRADRAPGLRAGGGSRARRQCPQWHDAEDGADGGGRPAAGHPSRPGGDLHAGVRAQGRAAPAGLRPEGAVALCPGPDRAGSAGPPRGVLPGAGVGRRDHGGDRRGVGRGAGLAAAAAGAGLHRGGAGRAAGEDAHRGDRAAAGGLLRSGLPAGRDQGCARLLDRGRGERGLLAAGADGVAGPRGARTS